MWRKTFLKLFWLDLLKTTVNILKLQKKKRSVYNTFMKHFNVLMLSLLVGGGFIAITSHYLLLQHYFSCTLVEPFRIYLS